MHIYNPTARADIDSYEQVSPAQLRGEKIMNAIFATIRDEDVKYANMQADSVQPYKNDLWSNVISLIPSNSWLIFDGESAGIFERTAKLYHINITLSIPLTEISYKLPIKINLKLHTFSILLSFLTLEDPKKE